MKLTMLSLPVFKVIHLRMLNGIWLEFIIQAVSYRVRKRWLNTTSNCIITVSLSEFALSAVIDRPTKLSMAKY